MLDVEIEQNETTTVPVADTVVSLPVVYHAESDSDPLTWYEHNKVQVTHALLNYGAVLLRGFKVRELNDFHRFSSLAITRSARYVGGATPRKNLTDKVATSTEFPQDQEIKLHNELSYEQELPKKLLFCCIVPPGSGGQTPIADVNKVHSLIDPSIIKEFEAKNGWKLVRNFGRMFGPTLEKGFGSADMAVIEADCQSRGIELDIISDKVVRTTQVVPATRQHPLSGLPLWINHVAFWHTSSLEKSQYEVMAQLFKGDEFPYNVFFGDGSEIPDDYVANIRQAYKQAEVVFDWQQGDIMMVDNYRVAHGRKPFTGQRAILVSMGD